MDLKSEIKQYAKSLGFDKVGFASARPFLEEKRVLVEREDAGLISPFEESNIELRCFPEELFPGAKTIICFAIGYLTLVLNENDKQSIGPSGKISRYAKVIDYHEVLREKLVHMVDFISQKRKGNFKIFVDTGSLLEKAAAQRAGIGWIGENTCLFVKDLGSWVFLGEILTDLDFEPDEPAENLCDHCGNCVRACPTGALFAPYQINPFMCLSYITQMRGNIPKEFRSLMGNRIFGCDTCQEVCPKNLKVKIPNHQEFIPNMPVETDLYKLVKMQNAEFKVSFGKTAASWRGKNVIRRNAICALGNIRHKASSEVFKELLNDPSEMIREHARWALKRM